MKPNQSGVSTVEYAVMLILVVIAVLAFGDAVSNAVTGVFDNLVSGLDGK